MFVASSPDAQSPIAMWNRARDVWETASIDLLSELSDVFWETLPPSGSMRNGALWKRPRLVPHTGGSGYSLLPTPRVSDSNGAGRNGRPNRSDSAGAAIRYPIQHIEKLLPTPQAHDERGGKTPDQVAAMRARGHGVSNLNEVTVNDIRLMPTPQVADAEGGHATRSGDRSNELLLPGLARAAGTGALLPTPRASRGAASTETMYALGAERTDDGDAQGNVVGEVNWGTYEPAVRRWEAFTRPAPAPTLPDGKNGAHRLSPRLPEWMMGYPDGWVTDILARNPAIKACGNGVCSQQAYAALGGLWPRVLESLERAA